MDVRLAGPADAQALCSLNGAFNGQGLADVGHIAAVLAQPGPEMVAIATVGQAVAGFCCAQMTRSICYPWPTGEVTELFVHEGFRCQGVAAALVRLIEAQLADGGVREVRLLTGLHNGGAQAFYCAMGYERVDKVVMCKSMK